VTVAPAAPGRPVLVVLRALGLGDLLTAVPALRALADGFPGHRRVLATQPALAPLARSTGAVDEVVPARGLASPLDPHLRGAAVAVNLHGRGPESHQLLLAAGPGRLVAFAHPEVAASTGGPRWRAGEHEVARWCRLLEESGVPADPAALDLERPPGPVPGGAPGATLLHPGAGSPARRWPPARFAAVAAAELARGRPVLVTAGPGEEALAHAVARLAVRAGTRQAAAPGPAVHAVGDDVLALARLVAVAGRVVCGDTGVAHLATALATPSVVLCGPVSPALWGPPAERPWHQALWKGRGGDPHGARPDPSLLALSVDEVLEALDGLGAPGARPSRAGGHVGPPGRPQVALAPHRT
jgi:ADP-heptose:LPS heptosyltransferase